MVWRIGHSSAAAGWKGAADPVMMGTE